jgi:type 2 lantibiotic biosynthesis protein LanM
MILTHKELLKIVEQGSTLLERLEGCFTPSPSTNARIDKKIEARLKEWRKVVAEGDEELFANRLKFSGLDLDTVRPLLGNVQMDGQASLPEWTKLLNEILQQAKDFPIDDLDNLDYKKYPFLKKDKPIAFEEILLPCILLAREKLITMAGSRYELLSDKTHQAFERLLLQRLTDISSRVFEVEFGTFLAMRQLHGTPQEEMYPGRKSREQYLKFVKKMVSEDLPELYKEYCVLARMIAVRVNQWVDLVREFLIRLEADLPEIQHSFRISHPGKVVDAEPGLSDPHCGGRTVIIVTFEKGFKLVYKPKSMGLEKEYFQLCAWLNSKGENILPFKIVNVMDRGPYGWVEYIEHLPMEDKEEVTRYFQKSGMLLCLIYAFDGIDFHSENVIACGEDPVPIDLETFIHHRINEPEDVLEFFDASQEAIANSVLRTHFLPQLYQVKDKFYDITGMGGGRPEEENTFEVLRWQNINTDAIRYDYEKVAPNPTKNAPRIGNTYLTPEEYIDDIIDGFTRMYRFLMENKEALFTESSFTSLFHHEARFVFRNTHLYYSIHQIAFQPDYLREGVDHSLQIDVLYSPFLEMEKPHPLWPLIRDELFSFISVDIPKFNALGDADSIALQSGKVIENCFSPSPFHAVKEKIEGLNTGDLDFQIEVIRGSMDARIGSNISVSQTGEEEQDITVNTPLLDKETMVRQALLLAEELRKKASYSKEGEPSWVVLKSIPDTEQFMVDAMDYSLYDGRCGVALFLAAVERVSPGSGFGDMAGSTMGIVRRWLKKANKGDVSFIGIGGCSGLGSLIYTLTRLGDMMRDPVLYEEARHAAMLIEQEHVNEDKVLDIIAGSAGLILSLLACYHANGNNREVLDRAVHCGNHLLKNRVTTPSGLKAWNTMDSTSSSAPLLGFSHGAAGIAYALLKLYQVTGNSEFYDAAKEAIDYETGEFVPEKNNWPDFRKDHTEKSADEIKGPGFMCAWCHGAAGIGLARTGTLDIIESDMIKLQIHAAMQTTMVQSMQPRDHLCCGNMGRSEALLTAGVKHSRPEWIEEAVKLASQTAARAERNGSFNLSFGHGFYSPGLFQGTAGVGYHLLRLTQQAQLPAVLLLE